MCILVELEQTLGWRVSCENGDKDFKLQIYKKKKLIISLIRLHVHSVKIKKDISLCNIQINLRNMVTNNIRFNKKKKNIR